MSFKLKCDVKYSNNLSKIAQDIEKNDNILKKNISKKTMRRNRALRRGKA